MLRKVFSKNQGILVKMSPKQLQKDLIHFKTWAQENILLKPEESNDLVIWCNQQESILNKALYSPLKIGLLGGTGVGKSSIINQLAEKKISVAHYQRPYTNKIVAYIHKDVAPFFDKNDPMIFVHDHDQSHISHLILYDFPDYDSLIHEHRQMVQHYSKNLDIIIWVASPEKYADQAMLDMMPTLLQSSKNYCFVLNKIDQLSHEETDQIIGHWNRLLSQSKVSDAPIFAVSALLATEIQYVDNFESFKKWIFKRRKEHEIIAIKQSNVENQITQKTQQLYQQINENDIHDVRHNLDKMYRQLNTFEQNRQHDILELLTPDAHQSIHSYLFQQSCFLWPVGLAFTIISRLKKFSEKNYKKKVSKNIPEMFLKSMDQQINLLCKTIPVSEKNISLSESFENFIHQYQDADQVAPYLGKISPVHRFLFTIRQWLSVFTPVFLFIVYLGVGSDADFFNNSFQLRDCLVFVFHVLIRLFQPEGLVAMISLLMIEFVICSQVAFAWYKRMDQKANLLYSHLSKHVSKKMIEIFMEELKPLEEWSKQAQQDFQILLQLSSLQVSTTKESSDNNFPIY